MHYIIYNIDKKQKQETFCEILRETGDGSLSPFLLSPSLNLGQDILKLSVIYENCFWSHGDQKPSIPFTAT